MLVNIDNDFILTALNDKVCCCIAEQKKRDLFNNMYRIMAELKMFDKLFSDEKSSFNPNSIVEEDYYTYCQFVESGDPLFNKCLEALYSKQMYITGTKLGITSYDKNEETGEPDMFLLRNFEFNPAA